MVLGTGYYILPVFNSFVTEVPIIDLQSKSMDWFLYNRDLRQERVKSNWSKTLLEVQFKWELSHFLHHVVF